MTITDPTGRGPSLRTLTISGIATLVVIGLLIWLLMLRYTGAFSDTVPVTAVMTSTGDGLPAQADVKFRNVLVGSVASVQIAARGQRQRVSINLLPDRARNIPTDVTARVVPNNLFGVTALELVAGPPSVVGLHPGAIIDEDPNGSTQLQTTLTTLHNVLDHIEPEKLGRVLGTLAAALEPQYRTPGSSLDRLDRWITTVDDIPGIGNLLGNLGIAAEGVSESTPDLISALDHSVTTAQTLTERRSELISLLADSNGTVDTVNTLFARNPDQGKNVVVGLDDMTGAMSHDPTAIPAAVANLNTSLHRLAPVFHWGPERLMAWSMHVGIFPTFREYTAKDCPHYGTLYGPRCGGPTVPTTAPAPAIPPSWRSALASAPVVIHSRPPILPGSPAVPGLPTLPGPTAPAPAMRPAADTTTEPDLRGAGEIAAIVGHTPSSAEMVLLQPALTGTSVTVAPEAGR